jgi:hypothetical protein
MRPESTGRGEQGESTGEKACSLVTPLATGMGGGRPGGRATMAPCQFVGCPFLGLPTIYLLRSLTTDSYLEVFVVIIMHGDRG